MKLKLFPLITLSIILFAFNSFTQSTNDYFEGQIIYDITYSPYDDIFQADSLKEWMGSKMILTFKDGNYKKEYFSASGKKIRDIKLILKDQRMYSKSVDSDTITWVDITKNDTKITFEILPDSIVNGYPCRVLNTEVKVRWNEEYYSVEALYIYAKELKINPKWYSDFKEANYNEIMDVARGIAIVEIEGGIFWEKTLKMSSVLRRKVKNSEIRVKLNKKTPLKQL